MSGIIIKNQQQIDAIRKSCKLAKSTLRYIEPFVVAGISTRELDKLCEKYIYDHGAIPAPLNFNGYPNSTCISVNEVICHGIPNDYILKDGDIVNIDIATNLDGYFGDTCTMFSVGKISQNAQDLLKHTRICLDLGIKEVKPHKYTGNIGYKMGMYAHLQGYTIVELFGGHGVGIDLHEPPHLFSISERGTGPLMLPGMIFTIEPMLCEGSPDAVIDENDLWTVRTKDGKLSAQYEEAILVTKTGFEVLTA